MPRNRSFFKSSWNTHIVFMAGDSKRWHSTTLCWNGRLLRHVTRPAAALLYTACGGEQTSWYMLVWFRPTHHHASFLDRSRQIGIRCTLVKYLQDELTKYAPHWVTKRRFWKEEQKSKCGFSKCQAHWKVRRNSSFHLLFILPKYSFGMVKVVTKES